MMICVKLLTANVELFLTEQEFGSACLMHSASKTHFEPNKNCSIAGMCIFVVAA